MRSLVLTALMGMLGLALVPTRAAAQTFEITALSGSIEGHTYSTIYDNGAYPRVGKEYALALSPANGNSISASINEGVWSDISSQASLTVAATASSISFDSRAYAWSTPMGDPRLYMQQKLASMDLSITFTVAEPTRVQLTFDFLQQASNEANYDFYSDSYYSSGLEFTLARFENGQYVTLDGQTGAWIGVDTYGEDDGVFYASTLQPGVEYQLNIQSWATQGTAMANGSLNFSAVGVPVPEPSGALLLMLGLALFRPRSRSMTS